MTHRILLLVTDLEIGGTPTVVRELGLRLGKSGLAEVEVACLGTWGPVAEQLAAGGVATTALGARGSKDVAAVARLVRVIRSGEFDTVVSFLVHANAAAAAAAVFCHGVRFIQSIQTTQRRPAWHWRVQAVAQHAAERIIVPSESVAAAAREWADIGREKIIVIPNAIDAADFALSPFPDLNPRPYVAGFIGRLDPIKRVPHLLEAMALLEHRGVGDQLYLNIFGEGAERAVIESRIAALGLGHRVVLHGAISRPQKALARMGMLVLPSAAEGFGLVLIEAMASGVPIVATDVPGIRDVVSDGRTGLLVDCDSVAELADAMERVLNDLQLRRELIDNGLNEVRRYAWERVLPMYCKALDLGEPVATQTVGVGRGVGRVDGSN